VIIVKLVRVGREGSFPSRPGPAAWSRAGSGPWDIRSAYSCSRCSPAHRVVSDLARLVEEEHYLVSKHLTEMLCCDVVVRRQEGSFALYSLPNALTLKGVALVCRSVVEDRERLGRLSEGSSAGRPPPAA